MVDQGRQSSITQEIERNNKGFGPMDIAVTHHPPAVKESIDLAFAKAVICSMKPYSMFESDEWEEAFRKLGYQPPSRNVIAGPLLEKLYNIVRQRVKEEILRPGNPINVVVDESTNVSNERIQNTSIVTMDGRSFHWLSEDLGSAQQSADEIAKTILAHLIEITEGDLSMINSLATDTCNTMKATWGKLGEEDKLKDCFFVPCDSHGIQLLIKDILTLSEIAPLWTTALKVVSAFKGAPLQHARLRDLQKEEYGKRKSLIGSLIVRWGSQVNLLNSVLNNKRVLKIFAEDFLRTTVENQTYKVWRDMCQDIFLNNEGFWNPLEDLLALLQPIHEKQKMSESGRASISYVFDRWLGITSHLIDVTKSHNRFAESIRKFRCDTAIQKGRNGSPDHPRQDGKSLEQLRLDRQLTDLHVAAYFLVPENYNKHLFPKFRDQIYKAIEKYCGPKYEDVFDQFLRFRSRDEEFHQAAASIAYKRVNKPKAFWTVMRTECPELASFALRLLKTPANSVAAERAFSAMNIIHTKSRNRLSTTSAHKATHIAMNTRAFKRLEIKVDDDLEEHLIQLEDELLTELANTEQLLGKRKRGDDDNDDDVEGLDLGF
jgi:hypothetical protein